MRGWSWCTGLVWEPSVGGRHDTFVPIPTSHAEVESFHLASVDPDLCDFDSTTRILGWLDLFFHLIDAHCLAYGGMGVGCELRIQYITAMLVVV